MSNSREKTNLTIAFLFSTILLFIIYYSTMLLEITSGDSAEFALAVHRLGLTHSPGYPIYILLGRFLSLFITNPDIVLNLFSAICASISVGIMSLFICYITKNIFISIFVSILFGLSSVIWNFAIIAEVYDVNILFLSLSMITLIFWNRKHSIKFLIISAVLYGISLGIYLPNLIVLPAFIYLILANRNRRSINITIYGTIILAFGIFIIIFSVIESNISPPLATIHLPNTINGAWKYFLGLDSGTMQIYNVKYYVLKIIEHLKIFIGNMSGLGIVIGILGLIVQLKNNQKEAIFMIIITSINFGYFTSYNAGGYYIMVTPTYYIFFIWTSIGLVFIINNLPYFKTILYSILFVLCLVILLENLPRKLHRAKSHYVTEYALNTFDTIPRNSILICDWGNFTVLNYFQKVKGLREDLTIKLIDNRDGFIDGIPTDNYLTFINNEIKSNQIFIDNMDRQLLEKYQLTIFNKYWYLLDE